MANGEAEKTCVLGNTLKTDLAALRREHESETAALHKTDADQWDTLAKYGDKLTECRDKFADALELAARRLPNWAVAVGWLAAILIGVLGTLAARG